MELLYHKMGYNVIASGLMWPNSVFHRASPRASNGCSYRNLPGGGAGQTLKQGAGLTAALSKLNERIKLIHFQPGQHKFVYRNSLGGVGKSRVIEVYLFVINAGNHHRVLGGVSPIR